MSNSNQQIERVSLPVESGDVLIENVGSEIRFWRIVPGEKPNTQIVRLFARTTMWSRQRYLTTYNEDGSQKKSTPARTCTPSKLYRSATIETLQEFLPQIGIVSTKKTVHLCYSGHGPSGGYSYEGKHFTVEVTLG